MFDPLLDEAGSIARDESGAVLVVEGSDPAPTVSSLDTVWSVDLCEGWRRIGEAPAGMFDGVVRNLAQGEWRLTGSVGALSFATGKSLLDVDTVRVVTDGRVVFAGLVVPGTAGGVGALDIVETAEGADFTLSGPDAWSVLASRIAYPTPGTGPPWADGWDNRTGQASTVAAAYVAHNLGSLALAARQVAGLGVVDGHAGTSGTWSGRLQPLDQLVARVCRDGGIVCRVAVDFDATITVTFAATTDRHTFVVISDADGLTKIEKLRVPALSTFVVAGGQGVLAARTFETAGTATGAARREVFLDQSSLATSTEVQQSATTRLATDGAQLTVRAELTDLAAQNLRYLVDFDIGDLVSIEIADTRYTVPVDSVTVHVDPNRAVVRPVLGAATPNLVTGLIADVANLAARLDAHIA